MKHTPKILTLFGALLISISAWAVDASVQLTDYYKNANGKASNELRTALETIISANYNTVSYTNLGYLLKYADTQNADGKTLVDIYSPCSVDVSSGDDIAWSGSCSGATNVGCGLNREHTLPQSWFGKNAPMVSDAFHIYATDAASNGHRADYPYGECNGTSYTGTNCNELGQLGTSTFSGYDGTVYEPADEYKGDIARGYFYMITRYRTIDFTQSSTNTYDDVTFTYTGGQSEMTTYMLNLMLKWHRNDPVSEKELIRNEVIYGNTTYHKGNTTSYAQHNRNPFIDYPCLIEYIWGDSIGKTIDFSTLTSAYDASFSGQGCPCATSVDPSTPTITVSRTSVDCGSVVVGNTTTATFTVSGNNLTADITLAVTGTGFSIDKATIAPTAGTVAATTITVTFAPTAAGEQNGTITISSTGATPQTVSLHAVGTTASVAPAPSTTPVVFFGTVVTNAHTFSGTTATLHLHISDLATDVTVASSDEDTFTVSTSTTKNTITPDEAAAGVTITLKKIKAGQANLTIRGGVVDKTYAITFQ